MPDPSAMPPQHDPIAFYRHVLRSGDVPLADLLTRMLRRDPRSREQAERALASLPRMPGGRSPAAARVVASLTERLGLGAP